MPAVPRRRLPVVSIAFSSALAAAVAGAAGAPWAGCGALLVATTFFTVVYRLHLTDSAPATTTRLVAEFLAASGAVLVVVATVPAIPRSAIVLAIPAFVGGREAFRAVAILRAPSYILAGSGPHAERVRWAAAHALYPVVRLTEPGSGLDPAKVRGVVPATTPAALFPEPSQPVGGGRTAAAILQTIPQHREAPVDGVSNQVQRTFDLLVALPLGCLVAPVLVAIASWLRWRTGHSGFYSQVRLTVAGRPFRIWKLRTMVPEAEDDGPAWPLARDPRVTPFGAFLRRTWLDELPQLWNVIRGDLSIVGPRPERAVFVKEFELYLPRYKERFRARGGLTGLAQVRGFVGNTSIRQRLACDREYIRHWTPFSDLCVLTLTLCQFFKRRERRRFDYVPGRGERPP